MLVNLKSPRPVILLYNPTDGEVRIHMKLHTCTGHTEFRLKPDAQLLPYDVPYECVRAECKYSDTRHLVSCLTQMF